MIESVAHAKVKKLGEGIKTEALEHPFWSLSSKETLELLSSREEGIEEKEAAYRLKQFGANELAQKKRLVKLRIFARQFQSPLVFILLFAAAATLFFRDWVDTGMIFLAIIANTALGFYQENRSEEALNHLKSYLKERARIIRSGKEREIDVSEIVPGDIVHLVVGGRAPADGRIISLRNLEIDEAILTGESLSAHKTKEPLSPSATLADRRNMAYAGTLVVGGSGMLVVCATGTRTEIGKISELVARSRREPTPLQRAIQKLAWGIAGILSFLIIGVFALGVFRGESVFQMFLVSIAMAVGSIPEALPVGVTMVLAIGVERLAKRNAVVRKLSAAESLGSTTVILTDKTGTLTEAKMQLVDIVSFSDLLAGRFRDGNPLVKADREQKKILKAALMNADVVIENPEENPSDWRIAGSPLERNLVGSAALHGLRLPELRSHIVSVLISPFDSSIKYSAALVRDGKEFSFEESHKRFVSFLGAPDVLLQKAKVTKEEFIRLTEGVHRLAAEGKRLLGVAAKTVTENENDIKPGTMEGLSFLGVIAFYDPIRKEVPDAMARVAQFGIRTVMVTGDLKGTALSVAREIGWKVNEENAIEGQALRAMNDKEATELLERTRIFARVVPEDKVRIAQLYQKKGEVVAMTGDGVNDAPSLKVADVGVAVGSGSDVAKDVADLVLLDNNFKTIVAAIEEGKRVLLNIRKVIVYLLSDSLDTILLIGGSLAFGLPLPLTALQILWVNFFSDSFPALAFAFVNHSEAVEISSEKKRTSRIFDAQVKLLILCVGFLTSAILFGLYWTLTALEMDIAMVQTFIFATFGLYTLFVAFPLKNLRDSILSYPLFTNRLMVFGVGLGVVLMLIAIYFPPLARIFSTVPLGPAWWGGVLGMVALNISAVEGVKWYFRRRIKKT